MIVWCPISELDILTSLSILALRVSGDVLLSLLGDLCVYLRPLLDSRSYASLAVLIYVFLLLPGSVYVFLDLLGFLNRSVFSLSLEISIGVS